MARTAGRAPLSSSAKTSSAKHHSFKGKGKAQANAAGYLKRKAASTGKKTQDQVQDVYEEFDADDRKRKALPGRRKLRKETKRLEYDWGEDGYAARVSEDEGENESGSKQPRLFGEGDEIGSSEDEDIDSDAAFEDEDGVADGFGGVFKRKKQPTKKKQPKPPARFADVDLDEDEDIGAAHSEVESNSDLDEDEEEESLDSDVYIDVLDVLDGKGQVWNGEESDSESGEPKPKPAAKPIPLRDPVVESDDNDDAAVGSEDGNSDLGSMDIDTSPEALTALHNLISSLPSDAPPAKRKADGDLSTSAPRKRRAINLKERTQAGVEGEFAVGTASSSKLTLDDFLQPLATESGMSDVRKNLAALDKKKTKKNGPGLLSAPLPTRVQDRIDRTAAYEETRQEVQKWEGSMKLLREAEHLSFPLQQQKPAKVSSAELANKFIPATNLETAVSRLLLAAQLAQEGDIANTENSLLAQSELSPEEILQRRNELRMMRELAFRAEVKARRVGKIKSKAFRKIARGKKKREANVADRADGASDDDEEKRIQREVERAKSRAGLKVKRSAKWEKERTGGDEETENLRSEVLENIDREERLQRLIRGEDSHGDFDSDSDSDSDNDPESIKRKALAKVAALDEAELGLDPNKTKGVFGMKFMQDAMRRKAAEAQGIVDDFEAELGRLEKETTDDDTEGVVIQRTGGRVVAQPSEVKKTRVKTAPITTQPAPSTTTLRPISMATATRSLLSAPVPAQEEEESNPWLMMSGSSGAKPTKKKNTVVVSKESGAADRAGYKLGKAERKHTNGANGDPAEGADIDLNKLLSDGYDESKSQKKKTNTKTVDKATDENSDDEHNSEVEAQETMLANKKRGAAKQGAFEQRELVAKAFAGDNVVRDFEEAKQRELASDAPQEIDLTLPGWGSWGGPHASSKPNKKRFTKHIPGILPTARADHGKAHVIISEKVDKKASKYLVNDLPYPYTSKAQYERSLETPVGREWNTRVAFQRGTLPKVVKKMGTVIEPLQKLV
ncbi:UTP14-domain-containing protein [Mycena indigotica]|uniref:UTP14-domain-containing protein n=1 Tax=Mycena indigotica TaxID=2126181 RepID=A0A8H6W355_9AGAR|nr:UTP14-domain-containing protein [Mycena indigotica]KAF7303869.1 UTP14-domain-containing protein [Mycena indigotica]